MATAPRRSPAEVALGRLATHLCCHPPSCGHRKFSECRNALVAAIKMEADSVFVKKEPGDAR
jgi:hypothetical protein